ncbi:hypothetical protein ACIRBX_29740 [Kitasatospora sp. NPDC096147]|uniref:hypothetical protein n=1 Tax=Kitasatospora sp. NPDC096147 TaxID=3364093 RepID=UPI003801E6C2
MTPRQLLAGTALALALAGLTGCGIRPTAVPVDAGAPAGRTACPSPVRIPEAPVSTPSVTAPGSPTAPAAKAPAISPAPFFSASPTPVPTPATPTPTPPAKVNPSACP